MKQTIRITRLQKIAFLLLAVPQMLLAQNQRIDLSGTWRFEIDRQDVGKKEKWFARQLADQIYLPGSMAENRKGDEVTLETNWTASIYDSSFFFNPRLEKFRQQ